MSPARKRPAKGARKTTKKVTREAASKKAPKARAKKKATPKSAKDAAPGKTTRKAVKKAAKRDARKTAAKPPSQGASSPPAAEQAPKRAAAPSCWRAKATKKQKRVAQPLESAEKKPGLGAKWACFNCGAKFYDLNRPDPICPKCSADQREQPVKTAAAVSPPKSRRPAAAPISRLLDDEEPSDARFDEDGDAEAAAELDIGKLDEEVDYLDDAEFTEESDD